MTTPVVMNAQMRDTADTLRRVKEVRAEALKYARMAQQLAKGSSSMSSISCAIAVLEGSFGSASRRRRAMSTAATDPAR
jgi:hypothetical protein